MSETPDIFDQGGEEKEKEKEKEKKKEKEKEKRKDGKEREKMEKETGVLVGVWSCDWDVFGRFLIVLSFF